MEKIKSLFIALLISSSALLANDNTWKSVASKAELEISKAINSDFTRK